MRKECEREIRDLCGMDVGLVAGPGLWAQHLGWAADRPAHNTGGPGRAAGGRSHERQGRLGCNCIER